MKLKEKERFDELIRQIILEFCGGIMVDCKVTQVFGKESNTLEIKTTYKDLVAFEQITPTGPIAEMWKSEE